MYHIVYVPYLNAELVIPFLVEATYGGCADAFSQITSPPEVLITPLCIPLLRLTSLSTK
jgi:hypothetical protein